MDIPFLVCVRCFTYNHVNYITDALNGFCMQKTNFPYVCCVLDDASTDGEQDVINAYLQDNFDMYDTSIVRREETDDFSLVFTKHKENEMCYIAVLFLKYNHHSIRKDKMSYIAEWQKTAKYEASCEGDDYWIDPTKLQKQVDALETHPECTIAFCKVKDVSRKGTDLKTTKPNGNYLKTGVVTLNDFLKYQYGKGQWVFQTSGYFYRILKDLQECYNSDLYKQFPYGDEPFVIWCLLKGKGYYIDDIGSCYRVQAGGYMSSVRNNPDFAINQQNKLIKALLFLDDYTQFKYHQYINNRILFAKFYIEYNSGHYLSLYNPRFYKILRYVPLKIFVIFNLRFLCPPLYQKLKRYRFSH